MSYTSIANLIPTMGAVALVSENVRVVQKKKKTTGDLIGLGMTNIVGTSLLKAQADIIGGL